MASKANNQKPIKRTTETKSKLEEFYAVAKESLEKMKNEVIAANDDYQIQLANYQVLNLEYNEIQDIRRQKEVELKGTEEKKLILEKLKTNLERQKKDIEDATNAASNEIDRLKTSTADKVNKTKMEEEHIRNLKKNQKGALDDRIKKEQERNKELRNSIADIEFRIKEYKDILAEIQTTDGKTGDEIMKQIREMNKFLAEI